MCAYAEEGIVGADHWSQANQMTRQEDDSWQHDGQEMYDPQEARVEMTNDDEGHGFQEQADAAAAHGQHGRPMLAIAIGDKHAFLSHCKATWLTVTDPQLTAAHLLHLSSMVDASRKKLVRSQHVFVQQHHIPRPPNAPITLIFCMRFPGTIFKRDKTFPAGAACLWSSPLL